LTQQSSDIKRKDGGNYSPAGHKAAFFMRKLTCEFSAKLQCSQKSKLLTVKNQLKAV